MNISKLAWIFTAGALFGVGLVVSDMVSQQRVLGFLTLNSQWDPRLGAVMFGALTVTLPFFTWLKKKHPYRFSGFPSAITARLLIGAALFGAGWGIAGFCPGPALAAATLLNGNAILFLVFMVLGMFMGHAKHSGH